jgi:TolB-like protein/class 3 adenylate cyclase/Flp pilus assembly protein TadD
MITDEQRKLAAIMFTDMVGYSALSQRNDKLAQELLEEHREILREIFPRFNGTEIKTIGDAFLIEFNSALEAAQCAIEIQRALAHRNHDVAAERRIELKIGVHIGDVVHRGGDVYGDGVNIASRIEPVAGPGGICVSMDVERQIRNALEARFEKLAPTDLKNISVPMDLFRIVLPWERQSEVRSAEGRTRRGEDQKSEVRRTRVSSARSTWVWVAAVVLAVTATALIVFQLVGRDRRARRSGNNEAAPRQNASLARTEMAIISKKSIAVLPFENLSKNEENAFFAEGVQDQILTDLAQIADLKVISRTSVMQYKSGVARNLREIGQQLGVAHLLEGSVQRAANKIRVNAQLIDARTDAHLWAQTYDLADVFAIQSEIAKAIAEQLQAKLSPNEKAAIEKPPTTDLAAFDLYTRAKTLLLSLSFGANGQQNVRQAIELLNQSVARDPAFFEAYYQLVYAHGTAYSVLGDHTPARLALTEAALQAATRLRPDAAETHLARANYLYYGLRDYNGALAELEAARRNLPNDPRIFELSGYIFRRRGQQEEGARNLERAAELDPRNPFTLQQLAISYQYLRRYPEEAAVFDRVLTIIPNDVAVKAFRAQVDFLWKAETRPLHETIDSILAAGPSAISDAADIWFQCALAERNPAAAERALAALGGDHPCWADSSVLLSGSFGEGLLARMMKDEARAHAAFTKARLEQDKIVQAQPGYGPPLCVLGLIDAALGRKDEALREGRRAIEVLPVEKDSPGGSQMLVYFAMIAAWAGEKETALQYLAANAQSPGGCNVATYGALKLLPFWDPLRGDPHFEKIVASFAPKDN